MSSRSTQQHHPPRLLVGRILLLITVLFSTASTPPARAQQSVDPGDEIAELAAQHQLDPTVVDAMLMAGMSAAQINPRSATLFAQERQLEPQVDPAKLLPATPGGAPQSPSARAGGTPIQTVALVMDGSGSIDANDFEIQRNGIRLAIQDPLLVPRDGTLALMVIQYAESFTQLEVPYRLIASDADANAVLAQIAGITQIQGSTNPGDGINAAAGQIQANATAADDTIICLSTDGLPNAGADVATALTSAQGAAVPLDTFSVIAIEDPGFYTAVDFHNFYDPLVFGGGAVSVVANSTEFASVLGATCFDNEPVNLIALEAVQVIQDWQDSVQLIANKATYVRAHFEPVGSDPVKVAARLHGRRGGAPLAGSPLSSINPGGVSDARLNAATRRAQFDQSLNFRLPDSWLTGTVELEIERVGGQANCQDNTDTANDCKVTVTFTPVAAPEVRFVRVSWTDTGGITHTPTDADIDEMIDRFRAIYPIASMVADRVSHTYAGTGVNLSTLNGQLATMRFTDFCWFTCDRIYYGVLVNSPVSGLANGIPGTVASGNLPGGQFAKGRNRHAHEIGHTLGIHHAVNSVNGLTTIGGVQYKQGWCTEVADLSAPDFPYVLTAGGVSNATIGPMTAGTNAQIFGLDTHRLQAVDPNSTFELMSYCGTAWRWISKATYDALVTSINGTFTAVSAATIPTGQEVQRYRLFRGFVNFGDKTVDFLPVGVLDSAVPPPRPPAGDYSLIIEDDAANVLELIPFAPIELHADWPDEDPNRGFFIIAVPESTAMQQASIVSSGESYGEITASNNVPTVQMVYPNGGENLTAPTITLRWDAADADGDALSYLVQYSRDNGVTWQTLAVDWPETQFEVALGDLGETAQGLIRVVASDGFQAADDTSDGTFTAPNHPPAVRIVTPQNNALFSGVQSIFLEGEGSDLEDGALAGANLGWESDVDGVLGNGALVMLNANALSEGEHKISLTGIDSGGLTHSDVITIRIFRVPPPPPASMTISADATSLVADGVSSTVIRVAVRDVNNDAVANYPVALATTLGNLTVPAATDATGVTTATLTSATTVGLATVSATAGSVAATVAVEFVRGAPATIALTADPTTLPADGSSTSTVTAVVSDSGGNLLPAQLVNFVTTLGTIPATATTDQDGVATVQLMAGGVGVATVTATSGAASNTVQVTVVGNTLSGAVFLDANGNGRKEPSEGGMAGVTVQLTATNGTALQSTTTDSNGSYRFLDLPAGAYVITIFVPTGYGATTSSSFPVTVSGTVGGEAAPDTGVAVLLYLPQIAR